MNENDKRELQQALVELYAVELLEYNDKNLLAADNKRRSEWRANRIRYCLKLLDQPVIPHSSI